MYAHANAETVESICADITKDQAIALVCCYHEKQYHGQSRFHRLTVCDNLRDKGLLHPRHWACTFLGSQVAARLS